MVDCIFNDRLKGAGIVTEALFEAVLRIAKVQVAGVDEVHWELMDVRVKNDYGDGVKVLIGKFEFCPYISLIKCQMSRASRFDFFLLSSFFLISGSLR